MNPQCYNFHFTANSHILCRKRQSQDTLCNSVYINVRNVSIKSPEPIEKCEGIFRYAVSPLIMIGQLFGVMPVSGITSGPSSKIKFEWKSKRTIYSFIITVALSIHTLVLFGCILNMHRISTGMLMQIWSLFFDSNIDFCEFSNNLGLLIFYGLNTTTFFCFLTIALKWVKLMKFWTDIENQSSCFSNESLKNRFILKIRFVAFGIWYSHSGIK